MIKVTVRENAPEPKSSIKEHKDATWAMIHNGVLSLYPENASEVKEYIGKAVAGYEPGSWLSWEKVSA